MQGALAEFEQLCSSRKTNPPTESVKSKVCSSLYLVVQSDNHLCVCVWGGGGGQGAPPGPYLGITIAQNMNFVVKLISPVVVQSSSPVQ